MIIEAIYALKEKKIRNTPCHVNRASSLGDPCSRRLVYERTHWEQKLLHNVHTQMIFDEGNHQETIVLQDLMAAGHQIFDQQHQFQEKDLKIVGHIDLRIKPPGQDEVFPCEIKSMSPHIFDRISCIEDFYNPSYPWLFKYPAQLLLYMLAYGSERGVFILKNKSSGALKEIWMDLDWDLGTELYQKADLINRHVDAGTLPERVSEWEICERCPFRHICLPDADFGSGLSFDDSPHLIELIDLKRELQGASREYDAVCRELSHQLEGRGDFIAGGKYLVTGKWIEPKDKERYWKYNIIDIDQKIDIDRMREIKQRKTNSIGRLL